MPGLGLAHVYLGLSQVPQSEVQSPQVVEDLGRDVRLHLLLQDAGGGAVGRQRPLDVRLLQDLSQLDPGLHVVWVLLRHLLQVTLWWSRYRYLHCFFSQFPCIYIKGMLLHITEYLNKIRNMNLDSI